MYHEHLLHAVTCAVPNQLKNIYFKHHKISERGKQRAAPHFSCTNFLLCSAYSAEKDERRCTANCRGKIFRRLIAKFIAQEASSEALELFSSRQLDVAVKCNAESIVHALKKFWKVIEPRKSGPDSN